MVYQGKGKLWDPKQNKICGECKIEGVFDSEKLGLFETSDLRIAKLAEEAGWKLVAGQKEREELERKPEPKAEEPVKKSRKKKAEEIDEIELEEPTE